MANFPYTNPKLSDGLRPFLDDRRKRKRHNDHGYDDWLLEYHRYEAGEITLSELMEFMDTSSYKTMKSWIAQYKAEDKAE